MKEVLDQIELQNWYQNRENLILIKIQAILE